MSKIKNKYHSRKFLNKKNGMAAIECTGHVSIYSMDVDIAISDCSRKVNLDFYAHSPKEAKEKLDKLDLLLSEIAAARCYYVDAMVEFEKQYQDIVKKSKSKKTVTLSLSDSVESE
jgi:hypothetical protein